MDFKKLRFGTAGVLATPNGAPNGAPKGPPKVAWGEAKRNPWKIRGNGTKLNPADKPASVAP